MTAVLGAELVNHPWPQIPDQPIVLVPVGSTEQHGPHLPLDTDTAIATSLALATSSRLRDRGVEILVAPALPYGASGEHQAFPGTISIGHDALYLVLLELVRSLTTWAGRVVLVNGHGGNIETLTQVVRQLRDEGHNAAWTSSELEPASDSHAGADETSVMLHLRPRRVHLERAEAGSTEPLGRLMPRLRAYGVRAVSENGVLGDPRGADARRGDLMMRAATYALADRITLGDVDANGQLRSEPRR